MTEIKRCFVVAPIGAADSDTRRRSDMVLRHIIAPVIEARGYAVQRADQISEPGLITSQVIQRIVEDPLVVADLSEWNPNVFYELALRHALRKPLIQLIADGERIPFDVAGMRTISFDLTDLDSVEAAKDEIARQVETLERDPDAVETPVSFTLDVRALREGGNPEGRSIAELVEAVAAMRVGLRELSVRLEMSTATAQEQIMRSREIESRYSRALSAMTKAANEARTDLREIELADEEERVGTEIATVRQKLTEIIEAADAARWG